MAALLALLGLQLAVHPGVTPSLVFAAMAAFAVGVVAARVTPAAAGIWLVVAPLGPALLPRVLGVQGPLADLVWMSGLAGTLAGAAPWTRWLMPPLWAVLLGGWGLVLILSTPILLAREAAFDPATLRDSSAITSWAMLTTLDVAAWTVYVVQTQLLGVLWLDWIYGRLRESVSRKKGAGGEGAGGQGAGGERAAVPRVAHAMWIAVTIASVVAVLQATIDFGFLNVEPWIGLRRATGTMADANAYGVAAALAGPLGFLAVLHRANALTMGALIVAVNWSGVWLSGSRTGLLCAVVAAVGLAIGVLSDRQRVRTRAVTLAFAVAGAVMAAVVLAGGAVGPLQRATEGVEGGLSSLWSRDGYGTIAVAMTREYPLTGVGAGAYRYLAPDYERVLTNRKLPNDNAQNWWRHQVAELGVSGALLVVLWSALIAKLVLFGRMPPGERLSAWTLRGMVLGIAVASLVGMPTEHPVVLLWFLFLVAWLAVLSTPDSRLPHPASRAPRWLWGVAVVLAVAHAGGHLALADGPLSLLERAKRFRRDYVEGAHGLEDRFRWTDDESRFIVVPRGRQVLLRMWAAHPDIDARPIELAIMSPCGVVLSGPLATTVPFTVAVNIPPGVDLVDATVRVSRTWSPADHGAADTRQLGVAVVTDLVDSFEGVQAQRAVTWPRCP